MCMPVIFSHTCVCAQQTSLYCLIQRTLAESAQNSTREKSQGGTIYITGEHSRVCEYVYLALLVCQVNKYHRRHITVEFDHVSLYLSVFDSLLSFSVGFDLVLLAVLSSWGKKAIAIVVYSLYRLDSSPGAFSASLHL